MPRGENKKNTSNCFLARFFGFKKHSLCANCQPEFRLKPTLLNSNVNRCGNLAETPTDKIADAAERENNKSKVPKAHCKPTCKGKFRNADAANFRQNAQQQAVLLAECPKKPLYSQ